MSRCDAHDGVCSYIDAVEKKAETAIATVNAINLEWAGFKGMLKVYAWSGGALIIIVAPVITALLLKAVDRM